MPAIYLTEDDVQELLDVDTAIPLVEAAFRNLSDGKAQNIPRARSFAKGIALHAMSAHHPEFTAIGTADSKGVITCISGPGAPLPFRNRNVFLAAMAAD